MTRIHEDTLKGFMKNISSDQLLKRSLKIMKPVKQEKIKYTVAIIFSVAVVAVFSFLPNTMLYFKQTVDVFLTVFLALFGAVLTGYTMFQALLGEKKLILLSSVNDEGWIEEGGSHISTLQKLHEAFADDIMLIFAAMAVNLALKILGFAFPDDWNISDNILLCNWLSSLLISCCMYLNTIAVLEVMSLIGNIANAFRLSSCISITSEIKKHTIELVGSASSSEKQKP